jgi:hypothetical protein
MGELATVCGRRFVPQATIELRHVHQRRAGEAHLSETTLPEFKHSAREIYEGYKRLRATWKRGVTPKVKDLLHAEYGIKDWQWTRLKVVYETYLIQEDELAGSLLQQVDDGLITISTAYRLLNERNHHEETVGGMTSLKLHDLLQHHLGCASLARLASSALAIGLRLKPGELSEEELAELPKMIRANGLLWQRVADQLADQFSSTNTGGAKTDGSGDPH